MTPSPGPAAPQHRRLKVYPNGYTGPVVGGAPAGGEGFLSVFLGVPASSQAGADTRPLSGST